MLQGLRCVVPETQNWALAVAFAALEQEGAAGLGHHTGQWDLTAMWQQIHAAFKRFSHFSHVFRNIHKFV